MAAALLIGLACPAATPPPWPPAVPKAGLVNGSVSIMGVDIGPITGPWEAWMSCDPSQPTLAKLKQTGATVAYGLLYDNLAQVRAAPPPTCQSADR